MKGWGVPLRAVCLISVATVAACSGERRSGAAATGDSAMVAGPDSAATRAPDTAVTAAPDTIARPDTAVSPAPAPPVARAAPAKKPVPKPKPLKPATPAPSKAPDTAAAAATPPADTSVSTTASTAEANAPLRDPYHQAPLDTVAQVVYDGWKQFNLNCARCHGEDVQGTTIAPHLIVSLRPDGPINTKELFMQTVCAGRPAKGMPSWCALGMDMGKIESIYSYVKGRSEGKIHPGRPAVKPAG
jgi:mono/diheme cytochrome c family protein